MEWSYMAFINLVYYVKAEYGVLDMAYQFCFVSV